MIALIITLVLIVVTYIFMQQKPFGKLPSGKRLERVKQSHNYRDGSFKNLEKTEMLAENVSYYQMMKKYFGKGVDRQPSAALPTIKTDLNTLPSDKPVIVWFGHSSYLIKIHDKTILVDPVFSERTSPVQYIGMKAYAGTMAYCAGDMPEVDVVIITHDHYDHLDYNSILALKSKTKLFCTALGVGSHLEYWGIPASSIIEFDWWDHQILLPGIKLTSTPARHFSGRGFTRNKTLWSSFVLDASDHKIFIGGDSGYDSSFKKIGEKFGPFDIALLENGQYDPMWPYIHMMPEEVVQASLDLNANVLMPVHWSKYTLALHPWNEPVKRAITKATELNVTVTTPKIGEVIHIGENYPETHWWE